MPRQKKAYIKVWCKLKQPCLLTEEVKVLVMYLPVYKVFVAKEWLPDFSEE